MRQKALRDTGVGLWVESKRCCSGRDSRTRLTTHPLDFRFMNNLQSSDTERRIEDLEKKIEVLGTTAKYRGRAITALALTVAALAVPVAVLVPIFTTEWSYAIGDNGKVSFHIASKKLDLNWINTFFPPSTMGVLLIAAALSLTGQGDKVGLLLARYIPFVPNPQPSPEASKIEENQR